MILPVICYLYIAFYGFVGSKPTRTVTLREVAVAVIEGPPADGWRALRIGSESFDKAPERTAFRKPARKMFAD